MQQMYNKTRTCAIAKKRYSFKKGYLQVSLEEKDKLKNDLKVVLNNPFKIILLKEAKFRDYRYFCYPIYSNYECIPKIRHNRLLDN